MDNYDIEADQEVLPPDYQAHLDKPESLPEDLIERNRILDQRLYEIRCKLKNNPVF